MIKLAPSILTADFMRLGEQISILEKTEVGYIHIDVMDGLFVPNISMGMPVIKSVRDYTSLELDVHLMIDRPERYIEDFAKCGSDIINIHAEACEDVGACIRKIKASGKKAGITIKPDTDYSKITDYIEDIDLVLVMSVEPGFGGQQFIDSSVPKIEKIANYIHKYNHTCELEIDGGITLSNVRQVINAGADVIVCGSSVFNSGNLEEEILKFKEIFKEYNR